MKKGPMFSSSPGLSLNWINKSTIMIHPHQCFFEAKFRHSVKKGLPNDPKDFLGKNPPILLGS